MNGGAGHFVVSAAFVKMGNAVSVHCSNGQCCLSDKQTSARDAQTQSCNNLGNPKIRN